MASGATFAADGIRSSLIPRIYFFQAEDGIRYLTVTGVQTCALPIFVGLKLGAATLGYLRKLRDQLAPLKLQDRETRKQINGDISVRLGPVNGCRMQVKRSEERRVGKECRSRWSPYH